MASADQTEGDTDSISDSDEKTVSFLTELENSFGTSDLYSVLGIEDLTCDNHTIKKAYHKLSIKVHPDRVKVEEREEATHKFQLLGRVYKTLSDPDRRTEYDQFGTVSMEDDVCPGEARDWDEYWRVYYPKILLKQVDKFTEEYQGSEDELSDLKAAYITHKGDMELIIQDIMCCSYSDDDRFRGLLMPLVESGELPGFDRFTKESKKKRESRKRRGRQEAEEAEELRKELGLDLDDENSLIAKIQARGASRTESVLNYLEKKYVSEGNEPKKSRFSSNSQKKVKSKSSRGSKK